MLSYVLTARRGTMLRKIAIASSRWARAAWGDRTFPSGGFLLNGRIGGHWRRTLERAAVAIEVHLYGEPKRGDTNAIEKAAADLGRFHGLPVELEVRPASSRRRR